MSEAEMVKRISGTDELGQVGKPTWQRYEANNNMFTILWTVKVYFWHIWKQKRHSEPKDIFSYIMRMKQEGPGVQEKRA